MLSFKPTFSLSSFIFIKRLFSSSSLSAMRVMSSAYMRLLLFLLANLIPACDSSSLEFCTCTQFHTVKAMVFPVFMYRCDNWTIKKAEYQIIFFFNYLNKDVFELWYWRRLLTVPWTARRSNQSIIKEISSEYSLEGLMLKLKLHWKIP